MQGRPRQAAHDSSTLAATATISTCCHSLPDDHGLSYVAVRVLEFGRAAITCRDDDRAEFFHLLGELLQVGVDARGALSFALASGHDCYCRRVVESRLRGGWPLLDDD